jgi:hypothetical protein
LQESRAQGSTQAVCHGRVLAGQLRKRGVEKEQALHRAARRLGRERDKPLQVDGASNVREAQRGGRTADGHCKGVLALPLGGNRRPEARSDALLRPRAGHTRLQRSSAPSVHGSATVEGSQRQVVLPSAQSDPRTWEHGGFSSSLFLRRYRPVSFPFCTSKQRTTHHKRQVPRGTAVGPRRMQLAPARRTVRPLF